MAQETKAIDWSKQTDGTAVIQWDSYLAPYADRLRYRYLLLSFFSHLKTNSDTNVSSTKNNKSFLMKAPSTNSLEDGNTMASTAPPMAFGFVNGFHLPNPYSWWATLVRFFSSYLRVTRYLDQWNRGSHQLTRNEYGVWSIFLPNLPDGNPAIKHNTKIKLNVEGPDGARFDRIPGKKNVSICGGQKKYCDKFTLKIIFLWKNIGTNSL